MYLKMSVNHSGSNILSAVCSYHSENDVFVESSCRHKMGGFAEFGRKLQSQHMTVK